MPRSRLFPGISRLFMILVLIGLTAGLAKSEIVFTGCPPYVEGSHCDSLYFGLVAVDTKTGKPVPGTKYFLVSGPGEVNEKTGLWTLHPSDLDLPSYYEDEVVVGASKGNETTVEESYCQFTVRVYDTSPSIVGVCGAHFEAQIGRTRRVPVSVSDTDECDTAIITAINAEPQPQGLLILTPERDEIIFSPEPQDEGQTFEVLVTVESGPATKSCRFYFDVFESVPIDLRIETAQASTVQVGDTVEVDLLADQLPVELGQGALMMRFDPEKLRFIGGLPGADFFDPDIGCGWQYFDARLGSGCLGSPASMLRLSFQAEHRSVPGEPVCYAPAEFPAVLAELQFELIGDYEPGSHFAPVDFYWCRCAENLLWDYPYRVLHTAEAVYDVVGDLIIPQGFPGPSGADMDCFVDSLGGMERSRDVEFHNGGIDFYIEQPNVLLGDINLNGIAYEIADAVMFSNYLVDGEVAFGSHVQESKYASDVNSDGLLVTISDFVYLIRVVIGDALPPDPTPSPNPMYATWQSITGLLSFETPDRIGAVRIVVQGDVQPILLADNFDMKYNHEAGLTTVLIYSFEEGEYLTSGDLVVLPDGDALVEITAATYDGRPVDISEGPVEKGSYLVRIEELIGGAPGQPVTVDVRLEGIDTTYGLSGYDLLLEYDASTLSFLSAELGPELTNCDWEYFSYRIAEGPDCGGFTCPPGLLRLVAVAETNNGDIHPGCDASYPGFIQPDQLPTPLFRLNFQLADDPDLDCLFLPIRLAWFGCEHNVLRGASYSEEFLSTEVFNKSGLIELDPQGGYPSYGGAFDECVVDDPALGITRSRHVTFINGGIQTACVTPISHRGDVNCNLISFEIADVLMYRNYFLYGLQAFDDHAESSILNSDVNADGERLTLPDLVFLSRIVLGDLPPQPEFGGECPEVAVKASADEIRLSTIEELGGAFIVIHGVPTPTLLAGEMEMNVTQTDGQTRIVIWPMHPGASFSGGPLVSFQGEWRLTAIELSSYSGYECVNGDVTIVDERNGNLPDSYVLGQNYPNPFNPSTTITFDIPSAGRVDIEIYNIVGQKVRSLVSRTMSPGSYEVVWDGLDDSGSPVSSGVYMYRMTTSSFNQSRKMLLLK